MKNFFLLSLFSLLISCTKHEQVNPYDSSGGNWYPPTVSISDSSVDIYDEVTIKADWDDDEEITSFIWHIDTITLETSADSIDHSFTDTGASSITVLAIDANGITSELSGATYLVTQSAPILSGPSDTVVPNGDSVTILVSATDTNSTGSIVSYYWDYNGVPNEYSGIRERKFYSDSGGTIEFVWGAVDDDTLMSLDSFSLRFNRAPTVASYSPLDSGTVKWFNYDKGAGKGSIAFSFDIYDPDTIADSILAVTISPYGTSTLTFDVSQERDSTLIVEGLDPNQNYSFTLTVADSFGASFDSAVAFYSPQIPQLDFIDMANASFEMGDNVFPEEQPIHTVRFTNSLWVDSTEVTQKSFTEIMSSYVGYSSPDWSIYGSGNSYAAYNLTWSEAVLYCNAKSVSENLDSVYSYSSISGIPGSGAKVEDVTYDLSKNGYRLPTEAEWEFLCRAATGTPYFWGVDSSLTKTYAWYYKNAFDGSWVDPHADENGVQPVATRIPNSFGLYDIAGNVAEWCNDFYSADYYGTSVQVNPAGPTTGTSHVIRGGSWHSAAKWSLRSGARADSKVGKHSIGFRVVRTAEN